MTTLDPLDCRSHCVDTICHLSGELFLKFCLFLPLSRCIRVLGPAFARTGQLNVYVHMGTDGSGLGKSYEQ